MVLDKNNGYMMNLRLKTFEGEKLFFKKSKKFLKTFLKTPVKFKNSFESLQTAPDSKLLKTFLKKQPPKTV